MIALVTENTKPFLFRIFGFVSINRISRQHNTERLKTSITTRTSPGPTRLKTTLTLTLGRGTTVSTMTLTSTPSTPPTLCTTTPSAGKRNAVLAYYVVYSTGDIGY